MRPDASVRVRRAADSDLAALVAIAKRCFSDPWSLASFAEELRLRDSAVWVGEVGASCAAYACLRFICGEAHVLSLGVAPEARRRGLARRLLSAGLGDRERRPLVAAHLEVRSGNRGAQAFYRSLGFEVVGRRRRYYTDGEDALLMTRLLRRPASRRAPEVEPDSGVRSGA